MNLGQWIVHGPIDLRASFIEINKAKSEAFMKTGEMAQIEATALGIGWKWGYDWAPVIKWALDGKIGPCPRPRGRPVKGKRDNALPD